MAANKGLGKQLMAGGALIGAPEKDAICDAFEAAANEWCQKTPAQRKQESFNDLFFDKLRSSPRGAPIAAAMAREVPALFGRGGQFLGLAASLTSAGGRLGRIAQKMMRVAGGLGVSGAVAVAAGSLDAARMAARTAVYSAQGVTNPNIFRDLGRAAAGKQWGLFNRLKSIASRVKVYPRFPDAMFNGRAVDVKGPGDRFTDAQARDYKSMSGGADPYVISCEACGLKCRAGCPKANPIQAA